MHKPCFAELLRRRPVSASLAIIGTIQILTAIRHWTLIACPVPSLFGIPCPGCGLTRASVYLLHGRWQQALAQHLFAPFVFIGLAMFTFAALAPRQTRDRFCNRVETLERRTGIMLVLLSLLIIYWLIRLFISPQSALAALQL